MATSITPWLEATLTDQLFLGNGWLQHKHRTKREGLKPDPDQLWKDVYRDNGSCLDIITDHHDPKNKTNLRILQLSPLTLTDGQTYITAHLTDECHRDLYTRHSLNETQPAQTAPFPILAVRKYILRHTPYGPPRDRLRFILHSFDWLGHSAEPLGELRSLFQSEDITSFVAQLHNTRIKEDRRCLNRGPNQAEERESSQPGPDSDGVVASMSSPNTQIPYGTQFVQPTQRRAAQDNASSPTANKAGPAQTGQARPASDVRMAQLLTLLAPKGPQSAPNPEPQPQLKPPQPDVPSTGGFRKPFPKIMNTPPGNQQTIAKHQTTESSYRESRTPPKQHMAAPQSRKTLVTPRESPYEKHQQLAQSSNSRGKKRAADEAASIHEPQGSLEDDSQPQAQSDWDDMDEMDLYTSQCTWMNDLPLTRGIFRIPLDQQKLLDRPESWQKPQAGHRFPSGNIPIMTLNLLSELADEAATAEQQPNPEQEMDLDSSSSTEPDEESANEPDKEPGSELAQSQGDEPDDSPGATQPSWSQSPTPEPPKRLHQLGNALPPDSSFGNQVDTADSPPTRTRNAARQSRVSPISIKSSNPFNTVEPPSSPPSLRAVEASEDEMEMETAVPQGLGQDIMDTSYHSRNKQLTNTPNPLKSSVQVEETPYMNFKSEDVAGKIKAMSAHNQPSSGTSKHTSSTSIIYASYEPHVVSSKEHPSQKQAVSVDGYDGQNDQADLVELQPEEENQSHIQALAEANHGKSEDVVMEDAPASSPASPSWSPSPVGEDSLAHQAALAKSNSPDELTTSFTKRKFEASPSKKIRPPKRREIKVVGFGADSPPSTDPASSIRRQRDESLRRFREERRANQIASKQSASPGWIQEKFPVVKIEPELSPPPQPTSQSMPKSTETSTVFERFKAAYPQYTADFRHFKGQCKSMYELEMADKMVSKWMWDDFIIRNRTDYKKYATECIDRGEEVEPYHRFYKDNIRDTIYQKGIVASRTTLMQALEELGVKPAAPEPSELPKRALRNPDDVVARTKSPPRDRPRHSLPVSSVQHQESATLPTKSSTRDRPRHSLPIGSHKSLTTLTSSQAHSKSSSRISTVPRSTPIPPPSSESTGDPFRDFIFAQQRMTSFTGSTKKGRPEPS